MPEAFGQTPEFDDRSGLQMISTTGRVLGYVVLGNRMTEFIAILDPDEIRRERAKARELRESQWWKRKRSTGICHYCGEKFPPKELTMDHLVPLVRGGRSTKGNLVPACKPCNTKKQHQLAFEFDPKG